MIHWRFTIQPYIHWVKFSKATSMVQLNGAHVTMALHPSTKCVAPCGACPKPPTTVEMTSDCPGLTLTSVRLRRPRGNGRNIAFIMIQGDTLWFRSIMHTTHMDKYPDIYTYIYVYIWLYTWVRSSLQLNLHPASLVWLPGNYQEDPWTFSCTAAIS
jgi:hypothetical protein